MTRKTWVLESEIFPDSHSRLRAAVREVGHRLVDWEDAWWIDGFPPDIGGTQTFFHGLLGNAALINDKLNWTPAPSATKLPFAAPRGTTMPADGCSILIGDYCPPMNSLLGYVWTLPLHSDAQIASLLTRQPTQAV